MFRGQTGPDSSDDFFGIAFTILNLLHTRGGDTAVAARSINYPIAFQQAQGHSLNRPFDYHQLHDHLLQARYKDCLNAFKANERWATDLREKDVLQKALKRLDRRLVAVLDPLLRLLLVPRQVEYGRLEKGMYRFLSTERVSWS